MDPSCDLEGGNRGDGEEGNHVLPPDPQVDDSPSAPADALIASIPQHSANNSKAIPSLLKNPPEHQVQATTAVSSRLPAFKDQAQSMTAMPSSATHQPTEHSGSNIPVGAGDDSTKGFGPDYKDQVRTVHPPQQQQQQRSILPSAEGVPVSSVHERPSTVIAFVLETLDDGTAVQPQQLEENREPFTNANHPPTVRKHKIWDVAVVVLVALVAVVVAVTLASKDTGGGSPPSPGDSLPPPTVQLETKLTASDGAGGDQYGSSVALAGDTIVAGAFGDNNDNGLNSGSVYVLTRTGMTWTEQAKLMASDGASDDQFGRSVAIDEDTIVVASYFDDDNGEQSGSVYVFVHNGTTWTQQAKLTSTTGSAGDQFGFSVAIDADTIVVGAYLDDDNGSTNSGSASVYTRTGNNWTEQAKLTPSNGAASDNFGVSVAISGDTIVVGARGADGNGITNRGSASVYTRTGNTWTMQAKLTASDGAMDDQFGRSVAMDGDTVVIGAWLDDDKGEQSGSAYVFMRMGATWTEQAKLVASDGAAADQLGLSVAIASDTIVVSADEDDDNGTTSGSAYVFMRTGTTWTEQVKLLASDGTAGDNFGWSVAIDGATIVVGAQQDDDNGADSGSAYIHDLN